MIIGDFVVYSRMQGRGYYVPDGFMLIKAGLVFGIDDPTHAAVMRTRGAVQTYLCFYVPLSESGPWVDALENRSVLRVTAEVLPL